MGPIGLLETSVTTNLRCMTFQKGEDLIYTAENPENTQTYVCIVFFIVRFLG
jgi:hypothetical protein